MALICKSLDEFKEEIEKETKNISVDRITSLDYPFLDNEETFTLLNVPSYHEQKYNLLFIGNRTVVFSNALLGQFETKYKQILKKKHGESTIVTFLMLKTVLKNYSVEFEKIRSALNKLDFDPDLDAIEDNGRALRRLTDRMEGLLQIIIELKEREIERFNTKLLPFDYDMLHTEARYWLERCRSHVYRISSLRTKSEMKANKDLNDTIKKLTVITTFLTIVSIVVNVPGTVGAIFGIPALSTAYFDGHTNGLVFTLILTTILSILLGYVYWRSLKLQ